MKSLEKRLNKVETLEYTKRFGFGEAMERFGVKDRLCFRNYLERHTGDRNFGMFPTETKNHGTNHWLIRQQYVEACLHKLANTKKLAELKEENALLDLRIRYLQGQFIESSETVLELCPIGR